MDEFPNIDPFKGYTASWSQPYLPTSYNPFYQSSYDAQERHADVMNLLYDLECIDEQVNEMLTYPDAERIINTVLNKRGNSNV